MGPTTLPLIDPNRLAPRPAPATCHNCRLPAARSRKRGRCDACYSYWRKYGCERPPHLWGRCFTGRLDER